METARYKVIVFDFDGTLVETAHAKRRAFYEVLPEKCHAAVEAVLSADPDGSRYHVIPSMIDQARMSGVNVSDIDPETAIAAYSHVVTQAVRNAPDVPQVQDVMNWAADLSPVYVFSMTPAAELSNAISLRSWNAHVSEAFGHPSCKKDVLARLIELHRVKAKDVLVVGDGKSDYDAAVAHGCCFYQISPSQPLGGVMSFAGAK